MIKLQYNEIELRKRRQAQGEKGDNEINIGVENFLISFVVKIGA